MVDTSSAQNASSTLSIPDEIRTKYPELLELILHSESMNDEERQYWINILPIMTTDQVENLRNILVNEKRQLAAIDKKYAKEIEQMGEEKFLQKMDGARKNRRNELQGKEAQNKMTEEEQTEEILQEINEA